MMLIVRADADAAIGVGHFMRSLALAETWQERGGDVVFLTQCGNDRLLRRAEGTGIHVRRLAVGGGGEEDLRQTLGCLKDVARTAAPPALSLDGYFFTPEYHAAVREAGYVLLLVDDHAHLPEYRANVLLNQNVDAEDLAYKTAPDTVRLFGPDYALLRSEFTRTDRRREIPDVARHVLVAMGGSDPRNVTPRVVRALASSSLNAAHCVVVVGSENPGMEEVKVAVSEASQRSDTTFRVLVDVDNMTEFMAWADLAVCAAGSISWELCYMGLPAVLVAVAENQRGIARGLDERKAAISLAWHAAATEAKMTRVITAIAHDQRARARISTNAARLVDGAGTHRVVDALRRVCARAEPRR